jgi:hypothetical protein
VVSQVGYSIAIGVVRCISYVAVQIDQSLYESKIGWILGEKASRISRDNFLEFFD